MSVEVIREGVACIDCTMVIANADTSGIEDLEQWESDVALNNPTENGRLHVVMACPEDCEGEFRHFRCDYCGRKGGGDCHPIAFLGEVQK